MRSTSVRLSCVWALVVCVGALGASPASRHGVLAPSLPVPARGTAEASNGAGEASAALLTATTAHTDAHQAVETDAAGKAKGMTKAQYTPLLKKLYGSEASAVIKSLYGRPMTQLQTANLLCHLQSLDALEKAIDGIQTVQTAATIQSFASINSATAAAQTISEFFITNTASNLATKAAGSSWDRMLKKLAHSYAKTYFQGCLKGVTGCTCKRYIPNCRKLSSSTTVREIKGKVTRKTWLSCGGHWDCRSVGRSCSGTGVHPACDSRGINHCVCVAEVEKKYCRGTVRDLY